MKASKGRAPVSFLAVVQWVVPPQTRRTYPRGRTFTCGAALNSGHLLVAPCLGRRPFVVVPWLICLHAWDRAG
jgi:hypothetical protein